MSALWQVSAFATCLFLLLSCYIAWLMLCAVRTPGPREAAVASVRDGAPADDAPPRPRPDARNTRRSLGKLIAAQLLSSGATALALFALVRDLEGIPRGQYVGAWVFVLPAALGLVVGAAILIMLSVPKAFRSPSIEPFVWLLALVLLGIGACYGTMILGQAPG